MLHGARLPAVGLGLCHELALLELTVAFPSSLNAVKPIVFAALLKSLMVMLCRTHHHGKVKSLVVCLCV